MKTLVWLIVLVGLVPAAIGYARGRSRDRGARPVAARPLASGTMLCALAFNLTFLWQEVWLVVPKAFVPGVHPTLYHNDHGWSGDAPILELLQGSGAVATSASGLAAWFALRQVDATSATWRLFLFWMAFQGLNQSLTQFAVGALLPGNDVGRALTALDVHGLARWLVLMGAVAALAFSGHLLARALPDRTTLAELAWPALLSIVVVIPFRVPRDPVEVVVVPLLTTVIGLGWLILGQSTVRPSHRPPIDAPALLLGPALALIATLAVFQLVLRPGLTL